MVQLKGWDQDRETRRQAKRAELRARIEKEIRTYLEANKGEEISTRELRENIEGKNDTIASVLNELAGQGRLRRRRKGKQRVLWSLVNEEIPGRSPSRQESLETGSQNRFPTRTEKQNGNRFKFN